MLIFTVYYFQSALTLIFIFIILFPSLIQFLLQIISSFNIYHFPFSILKGLHNQMLTSNYWSAGTCKLLLQYDPDLSNFFVS